jgi:serine protease
MQVFSSSKYLLNAAMAFVVTILFFTSTTTVKATGYARTYGNVMFQGTPLCAMVLANGQYKFSCSGDGSFDLNVPLDRNGEITLFSFASNFAPFKAVLKPEKALNYQVQMAREEGGKALTVRYSTSASNQPNNVVIYGTIDYSGAPVCAMALANGQYMFTCGANQGKFNMAVPLDANGNVTLYAFAEGFQPFKEVVKGDTQAFGVYGKAYPTANSATDSDVNLDVDGVPYVSNDYVDNPQVLPNPVILGGYANVAGQGAKGRSFDSGDVSDVYKINLVKDQAINVFISDPEYADLDLYLADTNLKVLDTSEGISDTESVVAPYTGTFIIQVWADAGASNYTLGTSSQVAQAAKDQLSSMADFIPGEVVGKFDLSASVRQESLSLEERASRVGLEVKRGDISRTVLLKLTDDQKSQTRQRAPNDSPAPFSLLDGIDPEKVEAIKAIKQLRKSGKFLYIEPNYKVRVNAVPNDEFYQLQWHYPLINLPLAWDITKGSSDVIVAVIDTGVVLDHPDLSSQLVGGYDFVSDIASAGDGDGIDPNPTDPGQPIKGGKRSYHGTHVAGTIGASTNNGDGVGGVAWNVSLMPLRVFGTNGGTTYDINQAILYAAANINDSGVVPNQKAAVINMSLGGPSYSQAQKEAISKARAKGLIVIAASGNEGNSVPYYPASYQGVVSVGAVDALKNITSYSSYGSNIDIVAPGGDKQADTNGDGRPDGILSTWGEYPFYESIQGTSMASPHVAGVAALMKAVNPVMTPQEFDDLLSSGKITQDLGGKSWDQYYGWGLIDAKKAVVAAMGGGEPAQPQLSVTPTALNFGSKDEQLEFKLSNSGASKLVVEKFLTDVQWLSGSSVDTTSDGLGTYVAVAERKGLASGIYTGTFFIESTANDVVIPVTMEVLDSTEEIEANAGYQFIMLVDPDTNEPIQQWSGSTFEEIYSYSFSDVPPGEYWVVAGTDNDNDYTICDNGESCGYLSDPITVTGNTENNDFDIGYPLPVITQTAFQGSRDGGVKRLR